MADISSNLYSWSTTASSNAPSGGTTIGSGLDDNLREIQTVVRKNLAHYNATPIASASSVDLGAKLGLFLDISGTTTITSFGSTATAGIWKVLRFQGALSLTYNATSMILPGDADITTAADDVAIFYCVSAGNWMCAAYMTGNNRGLSSGVVNVTGFGADRTGVADSTAAIQAALDSLATTGGTCFFPHGIYLHTGLTWPIHVDILGESTGSAGKTVLRSTSAVAALTQTPGALTLLNGSISNIELDGNSVGTIGLNLQNLAQFHLDRVTVSGFVTTGMRAFGCLVYTAVKCKFINNVIGIDIDDTAQEDANLITFQDCIISSNATYGLQAVDGGMITLRGCDIESNGTAANAATGAVKFGNMSPNGEGVAVSIEGCWFENNNGHSAIRFNAPAATPSCYLVRSTHIIGGTRTYGLYTDAGGSSSNLLCEGVIAQSAGTADIYESATAVIGTYLRCLAATVSYNANANFTIKLPDPTDGGINSIGSNTSLTFPAQLRLDQNAMANETRVEVWDVTAAALRRVTIGANDSGGAGFRVLRIPN